MPLHFRRRSRPQASPLAWRNRSLLAHRVWAPLLAGAFTAAALHAADDRGPMRGDMTRQGGPAGNAVQEVKPPLQTGEVKVPQGGVDTSGFDPNAGEGFKGRSTPGGGIIVPREPAQGTTSGAPLGGTAAPGGAREAAPGNAARGERGAGRDGATSGGTTTGGGADSVGSGTR